MSRALKGRGLLDRKPAVLKPFSDDIRGAWRFVSWAAFALLMLFCLVYGYFYAMTTPFMLKEFIAPLVPLGCLAVWALPEGRAAPTQTLRRLFFAFFVATMMWPNYLAVALPGLPWISAVRLMGLPLAIVLLVGVSTSKDFRDQISGSVNAIPRLWIFMAWFVAIQVITIGISNKPVSSANVVFDNLIGWTAVFFAACFIFRRPGMVEKWIFLWWVCAIIICVLGVWESKVSHVLWAGHVPGFFAVEDESVQRALAGAHRIGIGQYRVQSVQSTSLGLSEILAIFTPFVLHFLMGPYKLLLRIFAACTLPLFFYVILATDARLGVVGFFLSILLYLLIWSLMRWKNTKGSIFGPAITLAYPTMFAVVLAASFTVGRVKRLVWGSSETAASNQGRLDQLSAGIPKVLTHPWGYGTGRGADVLGFTNPAGVITIDNYILLVALDWGILGMIVFYGMHIMTIWSAAKYGLIAKPRTREHTYLIPAGISLTVFFVIKAIFSQTHNHKITFMMLGLVAALVYRVRFGVPGDELPVQATGDVPPSRDRRAREESRRARN